MRKNKKIRNFTMDSPLFFFKNETKPNETEIEIMKIGVQNAFQHMCASYAVLYIIHTMLHIAQLSD